jgi:type I restriction enzyme R subunit
VETGLIPDSLRVIMSTGEDANRLAADARARVLVDRQLTDAGWLVQDRRSLNLFAAQGVARREATMATGNGRADYLLYVDQSVVGVIEAKPGGEIATGAQRLVALLAVAFSGRLTDDVATDLSEAEEMIGA